MQPAVSTNQDAIHTEFLPRAHAPARARRFAARDALIFIALFAVSAAPILAVHTLPLRDFQAHLSRMAILAAGNQDPFLSQFYHVSWAPTGAFAMDFMLPPAVSALGLMLAGKLFVLLTFFLLAGGVIFLNYTLFKRTSWWPFAAMLLLYSHVLTWGFLNYLFGLGVLFWVFSAWLRTANWPLITRTVCFSLLAYLLLICHLYVFALYGACVISNEIAQRRDEFGDFRLWRQASFRESLGQFVLPVVLFVLTSPTAAHTFRLRGGGWSLLVKLYGLVSLVNTSSFWLDLGICGLCYAAFALAVWRRWLTIDRRLVWVVIGLVACYPFWPDIIFGGGFAAYRLPLAVAFIGIAASAPSLSSNDRLYRPAIAIVAALVLLQSGLNLMRWRGFDRQYDQIARIVAQVPSGKRVLFVIPRDNMYYGANEPPISYAPQLAVPFQHIFVNGAFVWPEDNSSLSLTAPYRWLGPDRAWGNEFYKPDLAAIRAAPFTSKLSPFRPAVLAMYDYLLIMGRDQFGLLNSTAFAAVAREGDYELFRLHD